MAAGISAVSAYPACSRAGERAHLEENTRGAAMSDLAKAMVCGRLERDSADGTCLLSGINDWRHLLVYLQKQCGELLPYWLRR